MTRGRNRNDYFVALVHHMIFLPWHRTYGLVMIASLGCGIDLNCQSARRHGVFYTDSGSG